MGFQRQEKDGFKPHTGELKLERTQFEIKTDRIVANDITVISDFIHESANRMEERMFRQITDEMTAVTKETGNTIVVPKDGSFADAFLEMAKSTEMMVSPDGKVSRPTLYASAEMIEKIRLEVLSRGPEFEKQIEAVRAEKEQHAIAKEAERLARYDTPE